MTSIRGLAAATGLLAGLPFSILMLDLVDLSTGQVNLFGYFLLVLLIVVGPLWTLISCVRLALARPFAEIAHLVYLVMSQLLTLLAAMFLSSKWSLLSMAGAITSLILTILLLKSVNRETGRTTG